MAETKRIMRHQKAASLKRQAEKRHDGRTEKEYKGQSL